MERYQYTSEQRTLMESMMLPFAIYQFINERITTLVVSDGFCRLFGYGSRDEAYLDMDHNMYRDTHPDDAARIANAAVRFATEGGRYEVVYRTRRDNDWVVIHARGEHIVTESGAQLAQIWYTDEGPYVENANGDYELAKTLSSALHTQNLLSASQYDYLTGLPSMTYFFVLADAEKASMQSLGRNPALLYMDFSGMKFYNSKHGFAQGDKVLQSFSKILVGTFSNENCCRIGADHFAVITDEDGIEERLEGIFSEFSSLYESQTPPVRVGIYPYRLEDVPVSSACDRAKLACTALRGSYASGYSVYSAELGKDANLRQYIIENIDRAIREKWIKVYYQPIIRAVNAKVCDEEALARWTDPVMGFLSPASFIPALEDAGLIYKLDLYVLDQVLEDMRTLTEEGLYVVPHSINLSRSDFDACDIVEEIRSRVDAAGICRDRITIEITESIIGGDFDFMREQVARFQALGFPVWMDDFGSGYSSLDVLQSIKFDLIKFDMSFMKKLDEGEGGEIILTELIKMAASLGVDTLCEGVETEKQVIFLQEIGCSKLQGFYYSKPNPFSHMLDWFRANRETGMEDPAESGYYESIGRVNLYDLRVITQEDENSIQNAFDTLPMGIIEVYGDKTRFVRSNQSYRDFIRRFFGLNLSTLGTGFEKYSATFMYNIVKTCCEQGLRSFYDEKMPDGSVVHSFARRVSVNPVTGIVAVAIAVLSISDPDEETTYADIARALAADYYHIYIVDLDTDGYFEYFSQAGVEALAMERHGSDFFAASRRDAMLRVYEKDREMFLSRFTKENIIRELDEQGVFTATYRLMDTDTPVYANMKVTRMRAGGNRIIIGVSIQDTSTKEKMRLEELQKERDAMVRIMALSDGYLSLYTVDPDTGYYVRYSSSDDYDSLRTTYSGEDFFRQSAIDAALVVHPDDLRMFRDAFTEANVLREIRTNGSFRINYRLMINGESRPVLLKAAFFKDGEVEKMVIGVRALSRADDTITAPTIA
ncbi:MAG: EAL domain-containing protein [Clostridia bacterium]|nr:EAL domain-containing protein [Clostridia bacterium]